MPTSLRFASGVFKNGSDPYRMYQTLTLGFGQMPPQTWMVPVQKYDVIHYIREEYLKDANPTQYAQIDRDYLDQAAEGKDAGPGAGGDRALGRDGLRPELDGDGGSRRRRLKHRVQGNRGTARSGAGRRLARAGVGAF